MEITVAYEKHEKMLKYIAWHFYKQMYFKNNRFLSIEDLISEANLAFIKAWNNYDPSKNDNFTKFLSMVVTRQLSTYSKKIYRKCKEFSENIDLEKALHAQNIFAFGIESLIEIMDSFKGDSRIIIDIILDPPPDFILKGKGEPHQYKAALIRFLKENKWSYKKINDAFAEIKEALYA